MLGWGKGRGQGALTKTWQGGEIPGCSYETLLPVNSASEISEHK